MALGAWAQEGLTSPPPDLSPEVFAIARELRCPVCQGESAAESNSGVAVEMRRIIAEMLGAGKSKEEIEAFFVERYGEWILYEPPKRGVTLWVWVLPVVGLILLGFGLFAYFRPKKPLPPDLLEEAERRLKEPPL
ncbi:MAG: cytochrome c-type biogenesis protein CcmH [Thermus sp.]|nr:cytochrome c-type biogenesis protein CcmH [Thermus sp.]